MVDFVRGYICNISVTSPGCYPIHHNLGTKDINWWLMDQGGNMCFCDAAVKDVNSINLFFGWPNKPKRNRRQRLWDWLRRYTPPEPIFEPETYRVGVFTA